MIAAFGSGYSSATCTSPFAPAPISTYTCRNRRAVFRLLAKRVDPLSRLTRRSSMFDFHPQLKQRFAALRTGAEFFSLRYVRESDQYLSLIHI